MSITKKARRPLAPIANRVSTYVTGAIGLLLLIVGMTLMVRDIQAHRSWVGVDGQVRLSEAVTFKKKGRTYYRIQMEVGYGAQGYRYSVPLSLPDTTADRKLADQQLARYAGGSAIRVFYNPEDPEDIELEVEHAARYLALPMAIIALGLVMLTTVVVRIARHGAYYCLSCGTAVEELHARCFNCGGKIPSRKGRLRE